LQTYFRNQNQRNHVFLIHRLDRDASGLLVFARSGEAYVSLKKQFFEHTISRRYAVVVHGLPNPRKGRLEHLLIEDPQSGKVSVTQNAKTGKLAILDYEAAAADPERQLSLLRCTLFTGRKHQIRVQLKAAGHVVCGDPVYGKADEPPGRLALHATYLAFVHPRSKRKMAFESPMPATFRHLADAGQ
jgi:23S rRNA pseudouridine1911/1915/1917 synthase